MAEPIVSRTRRAAVALSLLVGLGVLAYYTVYLFREELQDWQDVEVLFDDVGGLRAEKDPVFVAGARMGRVVSIELHQDRQLVKLQLLPEVQLHTDAEVMINAANSLGYVRVDIDPGKATSPALAPGTRLEGRLSPGLAQGATVPGRGKLLGQGLRELAQATKDIQDPRSGTLGQLLFDAERKEQLRQGLTQVDDLWRGIDAGLAEIEAGRGVGAALDPASLDAVSNTVAGFRETVGGIARGLRGVEQGEGTAGQLLADPTITGPFRERYLGIAGSVQEVARGRSTLGRLSLPGSGTERWVDETVSSLAVVTSEARAGKGVLGALSSPQYTRGVKDALHEAPEALANLRRSSLVRDPDARLKAEDLLGEVHDTILRLRRGAARIRMGLPSRTFHGAAFTVF